jgi:hypothetical protein
MNKPLSFIFEGVRYTTLFCDDEYLRSALEPGSNVVNCMTLQASGGFSKAFKQVYGIQVRDIPIIGNPVINKNSNIFIVSGTAVIDGMERNVQILEDKVVIEDLIPDPTVEDSDAIQDQVTEKHNDQIEVEDPHEQLDPTIQQEFIETVENKPLSPIPDVVAEKTTELSTEPAVNTLITDIQDEQQSKVKAKILVVGDGSISAKKQLLESFASEAPVSPKIILPPENVEESLVERALNACDNEFIVGSLCPNNKGCMFGFQVPKYVKNRFKAARKEQIPKEEVKVEKPAPAHEKRHIMTDEELEAVWKQTSEPDTTERWEEATATEEDSIEDEPTVDNKALKEQLRSKFTSEVNAVIGDIPHSILGGITEFTTNPVNEEKLKEQGNLYCIDNRWHKCGNWYCIDVVNDSARYFFNSKSNVSIEIPVQDLKEWLEAVTS